MEGTQALTEAKCRLRKRRGKGSMPGSSRVQAAGKGGQPPSRSLNPRFRVSGERILGGPGPPVHPSAPGASTAGLRGPESTHHRSARMQWEASMGLDAGEPARECQLCDLRHLF